MNTIRFNHQIKIIAHRGVSGLERENTCAAFIAAGNRSYYGMEYQNWRKQNDRDKTLCTVVPNKRLHGGCI